jgi:hypothetical protein
VQLFAEVEVAGWHKTSELTAHAKSCPSARRQSAGMQATMAMPGFMQVSGEQRKVIAVDKTAILDLILSYLMRWLTCAPKALGM